MAFPFGSGFGCSRFSIPSSPIIPSSQQNKKPRGYFGHLLLEVVLCYHLSVMSKKVAATISEPRLVLDKRGKPSYVLLPWERFKNLSPQEAEGLDIVTDQTFSREFKDRVRTHLLKKSPLEDTVSLDQFVKELT